MAYERMRDMREDNDLTQKKIAEYLMCDQSFIQNMKKANVKYR